jgi:hypothetical protein
MPWHNLIFTCFSGDLSQNSVDSEYDAQIPLNISPTQVEMWARIWNSMSEYSLITRDRALHLQTLVETLSLYQLHLLVCLAYALEIEPTSSDDLCRLLLPANNITGSKLLCILKHMETKWVELRIEEVLFLSLWIEFCVSLLHLF